ncbi:hypothetical protein BDV93DRAFT_4933 [Ceratobasidium sp. AG-I]|nr:hypothetical protein BDV93DRAFT_4933 [Ceratobasidium sp. AG-I]
MVFDATTAAFPQRSIPAAQPVINPPILSAAKPATPQSSDTANRPSKRRRINELQMPTPVATPSPAPELDLDALDAARRRSSARVMSLWESLAARYARALDEDDEIDILTGKIYRDRGVLRSASERGWKIGSFGGAMEVEPVSGVSEGETETGTSEADDEGDGEGAGDAEEGDEDDPFETWSYDWQYRAVSPPKPELSPKDAEDLEQFLATERAIQEEAKLKGKCLDPVEDEDDIVYLGDSLHDEDGALRDDETSDDEFASFMVDSSTIRLKDEDDEDEDEEVGPMSSILGSLAIGGSRPNRTLDDAPTQGAGGKGHTATKHLPNAKPRTDAHESTTSPPSLSHTHSKSSNIAAPASETGVEDELIVIDSDSDEELDADLTPRCQPKPSSPVTLSTSTASSSSKPLIRLEMPATSSPALVRSCAALTLSETSTLALPLDTSAPSPKSTKPSKPSFSAMVALLEASATTSAPRSEASTSLKSAAKPSSSTNTGATVSKRMLPKNAPRGQGLDAAASKGERHAPPSPAHRQSALAVSAKWPKATSLTDAPANAPTGTPKTSDSASKPTSSARAKGKERAALPSKRATSPSKRGKPPQPSAGQLPKAKIGMTGPITEDDKLNDKSNFDRSAPSDRTVISGSSSTFSQAPKLVSSAPAPTASWPATRLESPTK